MRTSRAAASLAALVLPLGLTTGCGDGDPEPGPASEATASSAVDVPDGVTLTEAGSELAPGDPASVVYAPDKKRTSVVTVTVRKIVKGSMKDFSRFSLGKRTAASTPYYVTATVRDDGPAGLGNAPVPLYGYDSTDTYFPPTTLKGPFKRCPGGALPATFEPGAKAARCFVYLVPPKARLTAIQVRTTDLDLPVSWAPGS